jgi:pimeloyl-ACP methyl ester carboxylesterase
LEDKILAMNPEHVTAGDIENVLRHAPAPQIILIHGGLGSVIDEMVSFSEFLMGMGYPGASLTNAGDGTYTFSCYESSEKIAGVIAWYYEQQGLRPMMLGHSQGGMQVVKVLDRQPAMPRRNVCLQPVDLAKGESI